MVNRISMKDIAEILSHLPPRKIRELEKVTKRIVDTGHAELIVLFGSYARGDYEEKRGTSRGKKSDYDILRYRAAKLDRRMDAPLPRETNEQHSLFNHLNYAYIGGRYWSEEDPRHRGAARLLGQGN